MNWNCVYIEIFEIFEIESGKKDFKSIFVNAGIDPEEHGSIEWMLGSLVIQMRGKKPSLSPTGACKVYEFSDDELGFEDHKIAEHLLHSTSLEYFRGFSKVAAGKYVHSPKARQGWLIVMNANLEIKKNLAPQVLIFNADFQPGFMPSEDSINAKENLILPELKKGMMYPHFDGANFRFDQLVIFQKHSSEYFDRMLRLRRLPSNLDIEEECLLEELESVRPETYDKYFELPEEDRRAKREVLGASRIVMDHDQLNMEEAAYVAKKAQAWIIDHNCSPAKIKLQIDDGIKFEAKANQLNSSFFVAQNGLEKFIIIRGNRVETKGAFNALEFAKAESLDDVIQSLKFDSAEVSNV